MYIIEINILTPLKVTGHSKIFFLELPPSVQKCPFLYMYLYTLRVFIFKISQFVPFLIKNPQNQSKIFKKGTNCEILNLNNRRLRPLKVHVIWQKNLLLISENPIKKLKSYVTSHFKINKNKKNNGIKNCKIFVVSNVDW